jgi:hypothetical protein
MVRRAATSAARCSRVHHGDDVAASPAGEAVAKPAEVRFGVCDIDWQKGPGTSSSSSGARRSAGTVSGGALKAIAVADRESHLRPDAQP